LANFDALELTGEPRFANEHDENNYSTPGVLFDQVLIILQAEYPQSTGPSQILKRINDLRIIEGKPATTINGVMTSIRRATEKGFVERKGLGKYSCIDKSKIAEYLTSKSDKSTSLTQGKLRTFTLDVLTKDWFPRDWLDIDAATIEKATVKLKVSNQVSTKIRTHPLFSSEKVKAGDRAQQISAKCTHFTIVSNSGGIIVIRPKKIDFLEELHSFLIAAGLTIDEIRMFYTKMFESSMNEMTIEIPVTVPRSSFPGWAKELELVTCIGDREIIRSSLNRSKNHAGLEISGDGLAVASLLATLESIQHPSSFLYLISLYLQKISAQLDDPKQSVKLQGGRVSVSLAI